MRALENRKPDKHTSSPFFEPKIQKKLKTGKAGDPFEAEADKVADQATNNHSADGGLLQSKEELPQKSISGTISSVQSKDIKEEKDPVQKKEQDKEESVQKKTEEKEEPLQKKEEEKPVSTIEHNLKKGGGNPLEKDIKLEMENFFGVDFSSIRIHTDGKAAAMCHEMGAQAFTNGTDIYFNKGKYNPNSIQGKKLLAHELTHTVQQGAVNQKKK